jgi:hypothetical protein
MIESSTFRMAVFAALMPLMSLMSMEGRAGLPALATEAGDASAATPVAVAASLARGAAWIWPSSNGPVWMQRASSARPVASALPAPPYREAAVLVESLVLRSQGVERGGRRLPLPLPPGVKALPVVHVESATDAPDEFTPQQLQAIRSAVRRHAATAASGAGMLQLDFEAPPRQWRAYRALVALLRQTLPADLRLSITALAHWCAAPDRWLDALPVDEVVPMLYRLGAQPQFWRQRFLDGDARLAQRCRGPAMGFATQEPPPAALLARTERAYWFDASAWSNPSQPPRHLLP